MEDKNMDKALENIIRESMKIEDTPSVELNNKLKARLYGQEAANRSKSGSYTISLWYLPMILNFLTFSLLAALALVLISNPYLARAAAMGCGYMSIVGIAVTIIGVKRTNMKEDITVCIKKTRRIGYES